MVCSGVLSSSSGRLIDRLLENNRRLWSGGYRCLCSRMSRPRCGRRQVQAGDVDAAELIEAMKTAGMAVPGRDAAEGSAEALSAVTRNEITALLSRFDYDEGKTLQFAEFADLFAEAFS